MLPLEQIFTWSEWYPLHNCWIGNTIANQPGLYRIRRTGHEELDYIGQTGTGTMMLKKRLGMLRGVYGKEMPYRDPHTAAPALWALRQQSSCDFEVSVLPVADTTPWRKGLESLTISLYRQAYNQSPTVNFGRMPRGYSMSSGNNARLVQAGLRFRGSSVLEDDDNHLPGIAPVGCLEADPVSSNWCGHQWSGWIGLEQLNQHLTGGALGLYRIRAKASNELIYIGQGKLRSRLKQHYRKAIFPLEQQGQIFSQAGSLECAWVENSNWYPHQRLELENDLIAAHILHLAILPPAQFLG